MKTSLRAMGRNLTTRAADCTLSLDTARAPGRSWELSRAVGNIEWGALKLYWRHTLKSHLPPYNPNEYPETHL